MKTLIPDEVIAPCKNCVRGDTIWVVVDSCGHISHRFKIMERVRVLIERTRKSLCGDKV